MATLFERGRNMVIRVIPEQWIAETLLLKRRSTGDTYPTSDSCIGERRILDKRDARVGAGLVEAGTITFLIDATTVTSPPRPHDKIVGADAIEYHINFAQLVCFEGNFWRCETTKAVT